GLPGPCVRRRSDRPAGRGVWSHPGRYLVGGGSRGSGNHQRRRRVDPVRPERRRFGRNGGSRDAAVAWWPRTASPGTGLGNPPIVAVDRQRRVGPL
ncbi:MAG: hypothetical protein AVDCRST_MAG19-3648, partial [uncultured Thermomicrobiales bacterium]